MATNDGFTDVVTAPATSNSPARTFGTFAPGVGPVFGQGGLVYIGNEQETLFALRPDGQQVWRSQLPNEQGILNQREIKASAVVEADGSIYVVGVIGRRPGQGTAVGQQATLYKFNAGGGLLWQTDFPAVNQKNGYTTAPPNIWSSGGTEVIMVPAVSSSLSDNDLESGVEALPIFSPISAASITSPSISRIGRSANASRIACRAR